MRPTAPVAQEPSPSAGISLANRQQARPYLGALEPPDRVPAVPAHACPLELQAPASSLVQHGVAARIYGQYFPPP